jgi:hypothetical protein
MRYSVHEEEKTMAIMHKVEIVVHVDDLLGQDQQSELINNLKKDDGVKEAHFSPGRAHLLIIDYDRDQLSAHEVLEKVRREHLRAELIGPI